ncbi:MAG TPA: hypothetical protein VGX52_13370, partial [Burkholderiales bacterium]|nr:hypothetical protein [Burkholderiales bacterium]
MKKILVADVPQMDARYSAALAAWEIAFAIGVCFDDSRMFDLVRALRVDAVHREVPIVCVRGRSGGQRGVTRRGGAAAQGLISASSSVRTASLPAASSAY